MAATGTSQQAKSAGAKYTIDKLKRAGWQARHPSKATEHGTELRKDPLGHLAFIQPKIYDETQR